MKFPINKEKEDNGNPISELDLDKKNGHLILTIKTRKTQKDTINRICENFEAYAATNNGFALGFKYRKEENSIEVEGIKVEGKDKSQEKGIQEAIGILQGTNTSISIDSGIAFSKLKEHLSSIIDNTSSPDLSKATTNSDTKFSTSLRKFTIYQPPSDIKTSTISGHNSPSLFQI